MAVSPELRDDGEIPTLRSAFTQRTLVALTNRLLVLENFCFNAICIWSRYRRIT
jgi:hypothetical protein